MADTNPKIMDRVREELSKNPKIGAKDLQDKVKKDFAEVGKLTARQFHARYPLQLKRKKARKGGGGRKTSGARKAAASREKVRGELLQLVKAVADAEGKAGMVDLVSGIDRYVERVVKAAGAK